MPQALRPGDQRLALLLRQGHARRRRHRLRRQERQLSPRPFFVSSLTWGGNTWSRHFEFLEGGLGSIPERFAPYTQTGYAQDYAWNLNPRDTHADGSSKQASYIGAIALKTATSRNGVYVSPYRNATVTGGKSFYTTELNQCEAGYRTYPDLATDGQLEEGILPRLWVDAWYANPYNGCSWAADWGLPVAGASTYSTTSLSTPCRTFAIGASGQPTMGINLHDTAQRRCPTWTQCDVGSFCCAGSVAVGEGYTCVAKTDGTAWCWGFSSQQGTLGNNAISSSLTPVQVVKRIPDSSAFEPLTGIVAIFGTPNTNDQVRLRTCARLKDGSLWCWGHEFSAVTPYAAPIAGLTGVEKASLGQFHSCAVKTDGTVACWGENSSGELGDGTTITRNTPAAITAISGVVDVGTGSESTCARRNDGTVWCWGYNGSGQLGDGTTIRRLTPVQVTGLSNVVALATGSYHSCAIRRVELEGGGFARTLWCWGKNWSER
ncbi:MAG: hypothetical protein IPG96_07525 [Proteobacteria bacterium]|nr:hypothetical protein [Pseudomonadota bacterium]